MNDLVALALIELIRSGKAAYMEYLRQKGLTEEQIKQEWQSTWDSFKDKTPVPAP